MKVCGQKDVVRGCIVARKTMNNNIDVLVKHYQNIHELTYRFREQRNKTFVILLVILGIVTLLALRVPQTDSLLIDIIAKIAGSKRTAELRSSFPFAILQSILMVAILNLIIDLHNLNLRVNRNFQYLGGLENEIRTQLELGGESTFFTLEGKFYDRHWKPSLGMISVVYILIIGFLLTSVIVTKIINDFQHFQYILGIVDIALSLFIFAFFCAYVLSTSFLHVIKRFLAKIKTCCHWILRRFGR